MSTEQQKLLQIEKDKILAECQQLLKKISRHRYSLKLLRSAKQGLEIIANYKPNSKSRNATPNSK